MEYLPGDPAPHFNLKDPGGRAVMLYDFFEKAAVVLAFFSAAEPERAGALAAVLQREAEGFRGAGVETLGIVSEPADAARRFVERHGLTFTVLADDDRSVSREFGAEPGSAADPPLLFVIDRRGDVRWVARAVDPATLRDSVLAAVGDGAG